MSVKDNLLKLKESIPKGVTLVAVSKTKPNELILEAYESGQRDFGENYVQELVEKQKELPADIHWHFIGHLQTNKVKQIIPFAHLIHGVDSVKLLKEINKESAKIGKVTSCLLQIYIADEETKFGLDEQECRALLKSEEFSQLKNIKLEGFMGMASNTDDEEKISSEF
ncbi:MAG TPA: YggS family pyridoxal phosphate-dependent enzyme, partial [Bacteroidia bacterium]|nr:YggS family pyridoxal phosphate-dependent enzyme [Bacteroidia bacterium]